MNEDEWPACCDPSRMVECIRGKISDRKLRQFATGGVRLFWRYLIDERSRRAVEVSEDVSDGVLQVADLHEAYREAWQAVRSVEAGLHVTAARAAGRTAQREAYLAGRYMMNEVVELMAQISEDGGAGGPGEEAYWRGKAEGELLLARLLRCVVGNPFRPVSFDPAWRSPSVMGLARLIDDERDFERMPDLAEALEESGCDKPDILVHCRGPGPHLRGCWVIDLALGKS